jgi:hypothetical protein
MVNDKTIAVLRRLGVTRDSDATSIVYAKLIKAFEQDPREAKFINAELEALPAMRDAAIAYAKKHYKLAIDPNTNQPLIKQEWDPNTLSWRITLKIADQPAHLAGRDVVINVQSRAANNFISPQQIIVAVDSKFQAAEKFFRGFIAYQEALSAIKSEFEREVEVLCAQFDTICKEQGRRKAIRKINKMQRRCIAKLSQAIYRAVKNDFAYNPNKKEMLAARAALKKCEVEMMSYTQRPELIHIYFQDGKDPSQLRCLLNVNETISDVSSDKRDDFVNDDPANYIKVTNQCIFLDRGAAVGAGYEYNARLGVSETFYRSASATILPEGADVDDNDEDEEDLDEDADEDLEEDEADETIAPARVAPMAEEETAPLDVIARQKAATRKILLRMLKEQLLVSFAKRNEHGQLVPIDLQKILVYLSMSTFLSPTHFVTGNELKQMKDIRAGFEDLDDKELPLEPHELDEITKAILTANPDLTARQVDLRKSKIIPRLSFFNAPVSVIIPKGRFIKIYMPIGWADVWNKYNREHNSAGLRLHRRNIKEFIIANEADKLKRLDIEALFGTSIDHDTNWKKMRALLGNGNVAEIHRKVKGFTPEIQKELITIILAYTRIQDYAHKFDRANANDRVASGYMVVAASVFVMNYTMGIPDHVTCKSGKDRTGLFCLLREALLDADNNEKLIENICNALRYSSAQTLNAMNVPGCVGVQIPSTILTGLKEVFGEKFSGVDRIRKILSEQQSKMVGSMGKAAYNKYGKRAIAALAKGATDPKAEPLLIRVPAQESSRRFVVVPEPVKAEPVKEVPPPLARAASSGLSVAAPPGFSADLSQHVVAPPGFTEPASPVAAPAPPTATASGVTSARPQRPPPRESRTLPEHVKMMGFPDKAPSVRKLVAQFEEGRAAKPAEARRRFSEGDAGRTRRRPRRHSDEPRSPGRRPTPPSTP